MVIKTFKQMILTKDEYENLWNSHFSGLKGVNMPTHAEYCARENALEDYLDIFRGTDTRSKRGVNTKEDHPYEALFKNNLEIKYVLIAEAAPSTGKYIYTTADGPYITSVLRAIAKNVPEKTIDRKLELANHGILILDLFPFAIDYNTDIRNALNNNNKVTDSFFNGTNFNGTKNIYSIVKRLKNIKRSGVRFNLANPSSAFIAPGVISHYLGKLVQNSSTNIWNLIFQRGFNSKYSLAPKTSNIHLQNNLSTKYYVLKNNVLAPIFSCCAYNGSGSPDSTFLESALNI